MEGTPRASMVGGFRQALSLLAWPLDMDPVLLLPPYLPGKTPASLISKQQPLPIHHSHCLISCTQGAPTPQLWVEQPASLTDAATTSRCPLSPPPPCLFCSPDWGMGQARLAEASRRFWALTLVFRAPSKHC